MNVWIHGHVLHKYSEPRNILRLHRQKEREREREIIRYLELDIYSEPKNIVRFLPPSLHLGSAVALGVILVHCVSFE